MAQPPVRLPPPVLAEPSSAETITTSAALLLESSPVWIVYDLEWTTWDGALQRLWSGEGEELEVVQIGAVKLDARDGFKELERFSKLVRPSLTPVVSEYFTNLTGITQATLDSTGVPFPEAFQQFQEFVGCECPLLSWGPFVDMEGPEPDLLAGDLLVLERNCRIHNLTPPSRTRGVDVKGLLIAFGCEGARNLNSGRAYQLAGEDAATEFRASGAGGVTNAAHDALWDARSIGCALRACLQKNTLSVLLAKAASGGTDAPMSNA